MLKNKVLQRVRRGAAGCQPGEGCSTGHIEHQKAVEPCVKSASSY